MLLSGQKLEHQHSHHLYFFCRCAEFIFHTFPRLSRSAKLGQRPSNEEDEQQPLSVHLWAKKHVKISLNTILTIVPLRITACVKDDNFCERLQLLQTRLDAVMIGCCQGDKTFVFFQPVGIPRFWRNDNSLFSAQGVHSPSIFLGPHTLPCQVSRFALASSSLAILSAFNDR